MSLSKKDKIGTRIPYTLVGYFDVGGASGISLGTALEALRDLNEKARENGSVERLTVTLSGGEHDMTDDT